MFAGRRRGDDQRVDGRCQAGLAIGRGPGGVQAGDPPRGVAVRTALAEGQQRGALRAAHDRVRQPYAAGSAGADRVEESRARPDRDLEAHDGALALGIDRRVRHLRERLAQVGRHAAVPASDDRERRVVAHAPDRLAPGHRHGGHGQAQRLRVETEEELPSTGRVRVGVRTRDRAGRGAAREQAGRLAGRRGRERIALRIRILEDPPGRGVDDEELARTQPPAPDHVARRGRQQAGLGGAHDQAVAANLEGGRAEPVAVQEAPDAPAVGEDERGGAVPRLDTCLHRGLPRGEAGDGGVAQLEGLGDEGEHRGIDAPPGGDEQLQRLVERGGVGAGRVEDRPALAGQLADSAAQAAAAEARGAPAHRLAVPAQRVDLAVVREEPERLGERPGRVRVGGVALVERGVGDRHRRIGEVGVEAAQLGPDEQALVDERPGRHRHDVERRQAGGARRRLGGPARKEERSLEAGAAHPARPRHHHLADRRRARRGLGAEDRQVHRDVAPSEDVDALGAQGGLEDARRRQCVVRGRWQEDHPDAHPCDVDVGPADLAEELAREGPREGQADPGAVAGLRVGRDRPAVRQRGERRERLGHDLRRAPAARVGHEADAARVVLESGVVERGVRDLRDGADGASRTIHRAASCGSLGHTPNGGRPNVPARAASISTAAARPGA